MNALLSLELRKNALAGASLALAFFVCLPASRLVATSAGIEPARALQALVAFWTFPGLMLAGAMLGAVAGAGLANRRAEEGSLPASPRARAAAAFGGASLQLLALVALVALAEALTGGLDGSGTDRRLRPGLWFDLSLGSAVFAGVLQAFAAAFAASYALGHALAGGLAGLLLAAPLLGGVGYGAIMQAIRRDPTLFSPWTALTLAAIPAGTALALVPLLARGERGARPGWGGWTRVVLGLGAAHLVLRLAFVAVDARLARHLVMTAPRGVPPVGAAPGVLAIATDGTAYWASSSGLTLLLPPPPAPPNRLDPYAAYIPAAVWHEDRLLVLRETIHGPGRGPELWEGRPGAMTRRADLPPGRWHMFVSWRGRPAVAGSGPELKTRGVCALPELRACAVVRGTLPLLGAAPARDGDAVAIDDGFIVAERDRLYHRDRAGRRRLLPRPR